MVSSPDVFPAIPDDGEPWFYNTRAIIFGNGFVFDALAAAHNPPLVETHDQYNSRLWRARYVSSQRRANRDQQMAKHQGIVDALLARNAEAASKALTAHLQNAIVNIKASIAERA